MSEVNNRKASGTFFTTGKWGELAEGETLSCVHCRFTWILQKGSGKLRGFCQNCMGYVCGPACAECIPFMEKVELEEAGKDPNVKPIRIYVPPGIVTGE